MALVLFDTETTGFKQNHVVELAALIFAGNDSFTFHSRCRPSSPIEDGAAAVHGITNEMVANERPDTEVVAEFINDIQSVASGETIVFAGHNNQFDMRVLRKYFRIPMDVPTICTMKLGRLFNPEAPNHKLTTLHEYLGLTGDYQAHAALDDVYMSMDILQHYIDTQGKGYMELAGLQSRPVILETMPFGKHKGSPISVVPASYINYMLGFDDIDPDVAYTFRHELARRGL